jgi:predicted SnoaL-like aldol condensation-catalyzing enzyme
MSLSIEASNRRHEFAADASLQTGYVFAERDFVMLHGRFTGTGRPRNWVAADIVRVEHGLLAEHWDVLQDEALREESRSGLPMFGIHFPTAGLSAEGRVA